MGWRQNKKKVEQELLSVLPHATVKNFFLVTPRVTGLLNPTSSSSSFFFFFCSIAPRIATTRQTYAAVQSCTIFCFEAPHLGSVQPFTQNLMSTESKVHSDKQSHGLGVHKKKYTQKIAYCETRMKYSSTKQERRNKFRPFWVKEPRHSQKKNETKKGLLPLS